jgi:hypothetical protein
MTRILISPAVLRAAECGDCQSQVNLAIMHDSRRGGIGLVPANAVAGEHGAQSLKWWMRAANQGSAKAQAALGLRYESGDGLTRNLVTALTWYVLAAPGLRGEDAERVARTRRRLSQVMAAADVQRAETLARAWNPQPEAAAAAAG